MLDSLYIDGEHYDRLMAGTHDLAFWLAQAAIYGDPILELACGTGRVTIPLAQAGHTITGLDASPAMLAVARTKAARASCDVSWVQADMRDFALSQHFACVILPANAITHLYTRHDMEQCLACIKHHLQPQGHVILHTFVPNLVILTRPGDASYPFDTYHDPHTQDPIVVTQRSRYNAATQINTVTLEYQPTTPQPSWTRMLTMRLYFPQELQALLHYNGFHVRAAYGDYQQTPFDAHATHQILICQMRS